MSIDAAWKEIAFPKMSKGSTARRLRRFFGLPTPNTFATTVICLHENAICRGLRLPFHPWLSVSGAQALRRP
jgi:hypothetical protein